MDIDELRETLDRYKEKSAPKTNDKLKRFAEIHKLTKREVQLVELLLENKTVGLSNTQSFTHPLSVLLT